MKYISILLSLILLTILVSCKKDETVTPKSTTDTLVINNNYQNLDLKNDFIGYCYLYDQNTKSRSTNNSGISVKVFGNNNQLITQTTTDQNGQYKFIGLQCGNYDLEFSYNSNYNTIRTYSVANLPGPLPTKFRMTYTLAYTPKTNLQSITPITGQINSFMVNVNPSNNEILSRFAINFITKESNSPQYKQFYSQCTMDSLTPTTRKIIIPYPPFELKGKTVQIRFYLYSISISQYYYLKSEYNNSYPFGDFYTNFMGPLSQEITITF